MEEERNKSHEPGDGGAQATAAGDEPGEEGQDREDKGDEIEDPTKAPHIKEIFAGGVTTVFANKFRRRIFRVARPGPTQRGSRSCFAAVLVVLAANIKVGPLRDGTGASNTVGVGGEEVGFL